MHALTACLCTRVMYNLLIVQGKYWLAFWRRILGVLTVRVWLSILYAQLYAALINFETVISEVIIQHNLRQAALFEAWVTGR